MQLLGNDSGVVSFPREGSRLFSGSGLSGDMKKLKVPTFVTSIQVSDFDVTGKIVCLNDKRVIYEFGRGFGTITIQADVLIGNTKAAPQSGNFGEVIDHFNAKRISENPSHLVVTAKSGSSKSSATFRFYLSQFNLGPFNAETGIASVQLVGDLIEMTG